MAGPLDDQVIPLIAGYLPSLKRLLFNHVHESYFKAADWLAISTLKKLRVLRLSGVSTSQTDMNRLIIVLKGCPSLVLLIFDHRQNANLAHSAILEIERVICRVVEECPLNDGHHPIDYHFCRTDDNAYQATSCLLEWECYVRS